MTWPCPGRHAWTSPQARSDQHVDQVAETGDEAEEDEDQDWAGDARAFGHGGGRGLGQVRTDEKKTTPNEPKTMVGSQAARIGWSRDLPRFWHVRSATT